MKAVSLDYLLDIKPPGKRKVIQFDEFWHVEVGDSSEIDQLSIGWYGRVLLLSFHGETKVGLPVPDTIPITPIRPSWLGLASKGCDQ